MKLTNQNSFVQNMIIWQCCVGEGWTVVVALHGNTERRGKYLLFTILYIYITKRYASNMHEFM